MKRLICLLLMGSLMAQNSKEIQYPIPIKPFELTYEDIQPILGNTGKLGRISLEFEINKNGEVENPIVLDSFNIRLNSVVIYKIKQTKYLPAKQNGTIVKVRYHLPIVFRKNKIRVK